METRPFCQQWLEKVATIFLEWLISNSAQVNSIENRSANQKSADRIFPALTNPCPGIESYFSVTRTFQHNLATTVVAFVIRPKISDLSLSLLVQNDIFDLSRRTLKTIHFTPAFEGSCQA